MAQARLCYTVIETGMDGSTTEVGSSETISNRATALNEQQGERQTVDYWAEIVESDGDDANDDDPPTDIELAMAKMVANRLSETFGGDSAAWLALSTEISCADYSSVQDALVEVSATWGSMVKTALDNPAPFADVVYRELGGV